MIEQIINVSRATFKKEPNKSIYYYFEDLISLACTVHPEVKRPTLKICYTLNRLCETLKFQNTQYIVYDQYLGQSFNKMNRLLFQEDDDEALAYFCKILSEEHYLINNIQKTIAYNAYYQLNKKAQAKNLSKEFLNKKNEICSIQESFVLFHEFAHSIVSNDLNQIKYAEDFLASTDNGKYIIHGLKSYLKENNKDTSDIRFFFEETACDFLATNFTYTFFNLVFPVKHANILASISAGFLFLRTIYDLKNKANNLYYSDGNAFTFFMKLRYNALRSYFSIFPDESNNISNHIEIYNLWEEKFDKNLVLALNHDFEKKLLRIFKKKESKIEYDVVKKLLGLQ